jgi:hypothetical protein
MSRPSVGPSRSTSALGTSARQPSNPSGTSSQPPRRSAGPLPGEFELVLSSTEEEPKPNFHCVAMLRSGSSGIRPSTTGPGHSTIRSPLSSCTPASFYRSPDTITAWKRDSIKTSAEAVVPRANVEVDPEARPSSRGDSNPSSGLRQRSDNATSKILVDLGIEYRNVYDV